ncbi:MAG: leucine-rich repeat domain-containing protein [Promethearchaeota archaeon]
MFDDSTVHSIYNRAIEGKIDKERAGNLLLSIIEESEKASIRLHVLEILKLLPIRSNRIFKTLENLLISDENHDVRKVAADLIIKFYLKEGMNSLRWVLHHEQSPVVIQTIFNALEEFTLFDPINKELNADLEHWISSFASNLGVVPEEARFFLDLEAMFAEGKNNCKTSLEMYEFCQFMDNLLEKEPWLIIEKGHVKKLTFNYLNWKYLKDMGKNLNSLMNINYLDLFFSYLKKTHLNPRKNFRIPASIGMLRQLEFLNLSQNNLESLPSSFKNLQALKKIVLNENDFKEIPPILLSLENLEEIHLKQNKIKEIPIIALQSHPSLKYIDLSNNEIKTLPEHVKNKKVPFQINLFNNPL